MAIEKAQVKDTYPLPAYNYRVSIGSESHSFSQVSGLSVQFNTISYRHGLSVVEGVEYRPGFQQPINITLEKGLTRSGSVLLAWLGSIKRDQVTKQNITIDLCDENGYPVISWQVLDAFPTSLSMPSFNASSSEIAIESLQLQASGIQVVYH